MSPSSWPTEAPPEGVPPAEPRARPATEDDLDRLATLHLGALDALGSARGGPQLAASVARGADHVHVLASLRRTLAEPTAVLLAGCLGDAVMGHAVLTVSGTTAALAELWVEPGARGVGVGSCLLATARSEATGRGCTGLDATALPGDRATKNFFEDHGMTARAIVVHGELGT